MSFGRDMAGAIATSIIAPFVSIVLLVLVAAFFAGWLSGRHTAHQERCAMFFSSTRNERDTLNAIRRGCDLPTKLSGEK